MAEDTRHKINNTFIYHWMAVSAANVTNLRQLFDVAGNYIHKIHIISVTYQLLTENRRRNP